MMESAYSWLELVSTRYMYWTSYPNVGTVYRAIDGPLSSNCRAPGNSKGGA